MKHNFKRFLSLLLAMVMVLGMFPMGHAHAEETTVRSLQKVTSVEAGEEYVITFAGTSRAVAGVVRNWSAKGDGLDTGGLSSLVAIPDSLYVWTMEADDGGFKIRSNSGTYVHIWANNASLVSAEEADVFTFTETEGGMVVRVKDGNQCFNNLGGTNKVGGWDSDGTKFDLYKVAEVADPYGKLRGQWSTYHVDTENPDVGNEGLFSMAFDNNPSTHWHSKYQDGQDKLNGSNTFTGIIDLGAAYNLNWFSYTPRQDGTNSGQVTQASLYLSTVVDPEKDNAEHWTLAAEHVAFADDATTKVIEFDAQEVRYVKFVAEASDDGWVTASEFNVGYNASAECEHDYEGEVTKEATCVDGQMTYTCKKCNDSYTKAIPATGEHTEVTIEAVAPTFENDGKTEGKKCSVCGEILTEQGTDPAGYKVGTISKDAITATAGSIQENNDTEGSADYALDGNFGTMWHTHYDGTDEENLWIDYKLNGNFDVTGLRFKSRPSNANGYIVAYEIWVSYNGVDYIKLEDTTAEDKGSDWKDITFANGVKVQNVRLLATETSNQTAGDNRKFAAVIEMRLVGTTTEHEHNFVADTPVAPTCTEAGYTTYTCSVETCGATYNGDVTAATGHTAAEEATRENEKAATCTEPGSYDEVVYCSVCKTHVISRETKTIDPLGHIDEDNDYICDRVGCDFGMCTDHTYDNDCDAECNNCGATRTPEDHVYDNACDADCNECGDERDVPGHVYDNACDVDCNECGATRIPADHVYDNACDVDCNECGATRTPADHVYTNDYDSACNECGATREVVKKFTSELINHEKITGEASTNDEGDGSSIEYAFDGIKDQASNYWASVHNNNGIEGNEYLIANLGGTYLINQVAYTSRTTENAVGNLKNYTIWVSTDKNDWVPVATGNDVPNPGTITVTFDPIEAAYVKLTATESWYYNDGGMNKVMAAAEFEIFKAVCLENDHDYDEGVETKAPTCNEGGVMLHTCKICGDTYESPTLPTNEHTYVDYTYNNDATCTADGTKTGTCSCGAKDTVTAEGTMLDHTYVDYTYNNDATCTADGTKTGTCSCGAKDTVTAEGTMLDHTYVEYTYNNDATCTANGTETGTCSCGATDTREVADSKLNHSYEESKRVEPTYTTEGSVTYKCSGCDAEYTDTLPVKAKLKIVGATMTLGNSLDMNFMVKKADLVEGAYAVITKNFADGREAVVVNTAEWTDYAVDESLQYVKLSDLSAKEMTDTITVVVYDAEGNVISEVWTDSMKDYAMRLIKQQEEADAPDQEYLTFAVDMLNYGAAAQQTFNYNIEDLANADLTEDQQAYATANTTIENKQVKDNKIVGATLLLQNSIQLNFIYKTSDIAEGMYAVATYTNHRGTEKTVKISYAQFGQLDEQGVYTYIPVADTAIADCRQLITLTVYNADGTVFSTATDSVESYCARINSNDALYTEIMKLADSAYALFH